MSTGFNPQYQQYPQYAQYSAQAAQQGYYCQPQPATPQAYPMQPVVPQQNCTPQNYMPQNPSPTASAVNIQIFNPTANAAPATQCPTAQPVMPLYPNASLYGDQSPSMGYPMNYNAPINQTNNYNQAPLAKEESKPVETEKKTEDKKDKKTKEKVILTDDYIKSLENYLNNQDAKIRLTATKELLDRFKEDKTRKADPALTALLNKAIQDPKASVRYIGLTILDTGYAQGNDETVSILKQLQNRPDLEYGEDSRLASQILLKMSGQKVEVPDDTPKPEAKQAEEKAA